MSQPTAAPTPLSLAVFERVFKDRRGTLLALAGGMAAFDLLVAALYPRFHAQAELVMKIVPSFIRSLMTSVPLDRPDGYAAWAFTHPIWIALACAWPIGEATNAIAGEIERGTLGWVLASPVSRTRYLVARAAVMVLGEGVILACAMACLWLGLWIVGAPLGGGPVTLGLTFLQAWLVCSAIGAVVFFVSACSSRVGPVSGAGIGLVIASAVINLAASLWPWLANLRSLSILSYFHPYVLLRGSSVEAWVWAVPAIVASIALLGAWVVLDRRDLGL